MFKEELERPFPPLPLYRPSAVHHHNLCRIFQLDVRMFLPLADTACDFMVITYFTLHVYMLLKREKSEMDKIENLYGCKEINLNIKKK